LSKQLSLGDYPVVIEPTVEFIEAKAGLSPADDPQHGAPPRAVLVRVATLDVLLQAQVPNGVVHFFGTSPVLAENDIVLGYETSGLFVVLLVRDEGEWTTHRVPPEINGQAVTKPSLRLTFKDQNARSAMLIYLERVLQRAVYNPTLTMLLERLEEAPQNIGVAHEPGSPS